MIFFIFACIGNDDNGADETTRTEFSGYVTQLLGGEGMVDVSVCDSECTRTDGDGFYALRSEHRSPARLLVMTRNDLVPGLVPVLAQPTAQTVPNVSLITPALIEAQMGMVDLEWEEGTGILVFSISNGIFGDGTNVPDIGLSTNGDVGDGPFYTNSSGLPTTELSNTSSHGGGVWINLPSGTHTFVPSNLPDACTLLLGWGTESAIDIPIQASHVTFMRVECDSS